MSEVLKNNETNTSSIFELNEQYVPFKIGLASIMKDWIHIKSDILQTIKPIEDTIHSYEDESTANTSAIKTFESLDHGNLAANLYVKFRHFMVVMMEIDQFIGYGMDDEITDEMKKDFRTGLKLIRASVFNEFFRITESGKKVLDRVTNDIGLDPHEQRVEELKQEINKLSVVKNPDTDRPLLYQVLAIVKQMEEGQDKTELKNLIYKKLSEADFSFLDTF